MQFFLLDPNLLLPLILKKHKINNLKYFIVKSEIYYFTLKNDKQILVFKSLIKLLSLDLLLKEGSLYRPLQYWDIPFNKGRLVFNLLELSLFSAKKIKEGGNSPLNIEYFSDFNKYIIY